MSSNSRPSASSEEPLAAEIVPAVSKYADDQLHYEDRQENMLQIMDPLRAGCIAIQITLNLHPQH
eukprot:5436699-Pyramimonas_sp.AAC.1